MASSPVTCSGRATGKITLSDVTVEKLGLAAPGEE